MTGAARILSLVQDPTARLPANRAVGVLSVLLGLTLAMAWPQGPVADPLTGEIRDPSGAPLVGVRVELLAEGRLVAATVSREDGTFRLNVPTGMGVPSRAGALALRAERLGYAEVTRPLSAEEIGGAPIRVTLAPAPLPLPGFRVEVTAEACPSRNDPLGEALWAAMARRHPDGLDTLGAASYTLARTDTLDADRSPLGAAAAATINGEANDGLIPGQRGFSGRLRTAWDRRVQRDGYAFAVRRTDLDGSYDAWSYAPLEADFASHFGTPLFASQHRFRAPAPRSGGGWVLPFCLADEDRPGLEGALELSADTLLLRVDWRFLTPEPDEEAGGWTRFPEVAPGAEPPLLLPLEAVVWRKIRSGDVQRRSQWFEAWTVTPGDSVPFLPERIPTPPDDSEDLP